MTKDELGDTGQCTENETWSWNQQVKKAPKGDKDDSMKWQLSRQEHVHKLYQVQIKESKTAVATGNKKAREGSDIISKTRHSSKNKGHK